MCSYAATGAGDGRRLSAGGLRRVLVVLCVTEVVSWGVLYYAFPVLAPSIATDTGWSPSMVNAAFSLGLVVSALVGIPVGRLIDRVGPRRLMTAGSVVAVPAVCVVAVAHSAPVFFVGWLLGGIAMSGVLYPPAFAALTRWWGPRRVTALTTLTLIAGLASTIFAPLTATLLHHLGWRHTYLVLAAVLAVVTIPAHVLGLRGPWPAQRPAQGAGAGGAGGSPEDDQDPAVVVRSRPFVLLTAAVTLGAFTGFAVVVNQVPLLIGRGLSTTTAAWALGLGGLGQVSGRLAYRRLTAATSVRTRGAVILGLMAVATALLATLPGPAAVLIAAAVLAGAARGVFTLLQATAISDRWGPTHYGRLNGVLSAPAMVATALGPWAGAVLAGVLGGYPALFWLLTVTAATATVLIAAAGPRPPPPRRDD